MEQIAFDLLGEHESQRARASRSISICNINCLNCWLSDRTGIQKQIVQSSSGSVLFNLEQ